MSSERGASCVRINQESNLCCHCTPYEGRSRDMLRGDLPQHFVFVVGYEPWLLPPLCELGSALAARGHTVSIVYLGNQPNPGDRIANVAFANVFRPRGSVRILAPLVLARAVKDLLDSTSEDRVVIGCDPLALQAMRRSGVAMTKMCGYWAFEINDITRSPFFTGSGYRSRRLPEWLRKIDFLLAPSQSRLNQLLKQVDRPVRSQVILNSRRLVNRRCENTVPFRYQPMGRPTILMIHSGRVSETQQVGAMVESLRLLPPNVGLIVAGPTQRDYRERLLKQSITSGVDGRFSLLERLSRSELDMVLRHCQIGFVLYDKGKTGDVADPAPNKISDYASHGLAMVGTRQPYIREWLETRGCGVCVDEPTASAIASAVATLLDGEALTRARRAALDAAASELNMDAQASKLLALLESLT